MSIGTALMAVLKERGEYTTRYAGRSPNLLLAHPHFFAKLVEELQRYDYREPSEPHALQTVHGMQLLICATLPFNSFAVTKIQEFL